MVFSGAAPAVQSQSRRFYDGGLPAHDGAASVPPDPSRDPLVVLERLTEDGVERFRMLRRIAYRDRHLGEILVPADLQTFRTDLTSVPAFFTWLVPKTGTHLPAALLHDGLVDSGESPADQRSYVSAAPVDRVQADRVFRDAMADTGTGLIRRWIVWSAVALATIFSNGVPSWSPLTRWRYRGAAAITVIVVGYLGYCATADLFDVSWPLASALPWMGQRPWMVEVAGGLAAAVVIPVLLGLTWGRFRVAGIINATLLAVLLHVTLGVLAISAGYWAAERLVARWPRAMSVAAVLGLASATIGLVMLLS